MTDRVYLVRDREGLYYSGEGQPWTDVSRLAMALDRDTARARVHRYWGRGAVMVEVVITTELLDEGSGSA